MFSFSYFMQVYYATWDSSHFHNAAVGCNSVNYVCSVAVRPRFRRQGNKRLTLIVNMLKMCTTWLIECFILLWWGWSKMYPHQAIGRHNYISRMRLRFSWSKRYMWTVSTGILLHWQWFCIWGQIQIKRKGSPQCRVWTLLGRKDNGGSWSCRLIGLW